MPSFVTLEAFLTSCRNCSKFVHVVFCSAEFAKEAMQGLTLKKSKMREALDIRQGLFVADWLPPGN